MEDGYGGLRAIKLPAFYAPNINLRVLSTWWFLNCYDGETVSSDRSCFTLSGLPGDLTRGPVVVPIDEDTNLPMVKAYNFYGTEFDMPCYNDEDFADTVALDVNVALASVVKADPEDQREPSRYRDRSSQTGGRALSELAPGLGLESQRENDSLPEAEVNQALNVRPNRKKIRITVPISLILTAAVSMLPDQTIRGSPLQWTGNRNVITVLISLILTAAVSMLLDQPIRGSPLKWNWTRNVNQMMMM